MAATLTVEYIPSYSGNHRICFKTTGDSYCCYNDDSASIIGVIKTTVIDLDDFELCLGTLPEPIGCDGSTIEGYVQPVCIESTSDLNRVLFTALFSSTPCAPYKITCDESGISEITINDPGYGWPVGVVPTVTVIDSSSQGIDFAGELTMNCLPGDNFCSIGDITITNAGENYYNLNDLTVEVSPLPSCISNTELITNGNFSDGFNGWTLSPTGVVPDAWTIPAGSASYLMELYSVTQPGTISQNILTPGKTYDISFKVSIGSVNGNSYFIVSAGTFDPSGTKPNQYLHTQPAGVAFLNNVSITLPCTGTSEFSIYVYSDVAESAAAIFDIDNISVTETCTAINPDLQVTALTNCGTFTVPDCDGTANPITYELSGGPQYAVNVCSGGSGPDAPGYTVTPNPTIPVEGPDLVDFTDPGNLTLTGDLVWNCAGSPYVNGICSPELTSGGQVIFDGLTIGKTYSVVINANSLLQNTITLTCGTTNIPITGSGFYPALGETYTFVADSTQVSLDIPSLTKGTVLGQFSVTEITQEDISCCNCTKYDVTNTALTDAFDYNYVDCLDQTIKTATIQAQQTQQVCAVVSSVWPVDPANNQYFEYAASGIQDC